MTGPHVLPGWGASGSRGSFRVIWNPGQAHKAFTKRLGMVHGDGWTGCYLMFAAFRNAINCMYQNVTGSAPCMAGRAKFSLSPSACRNIGLVCRALEGTLDLLVGTPCKALTRGRLLAVTWHTDGTTNVLLPEQACTSLEEALRNL